MSVLGATNDSYAFRKGCDRPTHIELQIAKNAMLLWSFCMGLDVMLVWMEVYAENALATISLLVIFLVFANLLRASRQKVEGYYAQSKGL